MGERRAHAGQRDPGRPSRLSAFGRWGTTWIVAIALALLIGVLFVLPALVADDPIGEAETPPPDVVQSSGPASGSPEGAPEGDPSTEDGLAAH